MIFISVKEPLPFFRPYRIKDLLEDETFTIPSYQRSFSWGTDEVEDLLEDIVNVSQGNESLHFFGTIITIPTSQQNPNKWDLIDGQQRITVSIVFLAVLKNRAEALLTNSMTSTTQKLDYIISAINLMLFGSNDNDKQKADFLILQLKNFDNDEQKSYKRFFDGLIINDKYHPFTKYLKKNNRPIKLLNNAYHVVCSKVNAILGKWKTKSAKTNALSHLMQAFISRFYMVVMKANSRPDAMTIYTTINTRGKNLSVPDLIKASLAIVIGQAGKSVQKYMSTWMRITSPFKKEQDISSFIKLYWIASSGQKDSVHSLPRYVTQEINTDQKAIKMICDLAALGPVYRELLRPQLKDSNQFGKLDQQIYILKSMGLTHYYSLMLTLSHNQYSLDEINKVLSVITKLEMRTVLKGESYPSFVTLAHQFWNQGDDFNDLVETLNQNLSHYSDQDTYQSVQDYQCRITETETAQRYRIISYVLACIFAKKNHDFTAPDAIYNEVFSKRHYVLIHLDHEDQDCINDFGNCTLIERELGGKITKQSPQRLIAILGQSKLISNRKLAQEILDNQANLRAVVMRRQDRIATAFTEIW